MSPEQVKGQPIDGRSDVFAGGILLWELVCGEKAFSGRMLGLRHAWRRVGEARSPSRARAIPPARRASAGESSRRCPGHPPAVPERVRLHDQLARSRWRQRRFRIRRWRSGCARSSGSTSTRSKGACGLDGCRSPAAAAHRAAAGIVSELAQTAARADAGAGARSSCSTAGGAAARAQRPRALLPGRDAGAATPAAARSRTSCRR